jgi:hypothetical protein
MPRYFFNVIDNRRVEDEDMDGTELASLDDVRREALRMTGEILRDGGPEFWNGTEWMMRVLDQAGRPVFTLRFVTTAHEWRDARSA